MIKMIAGEKIRKGDLVYFKKDKAYKAKPPSILRRFWWKIVEKVGKDKLGHVLVNVVIILSIGLGDIWAAVGLAIAVSTCKEVYDFISPDGSCNPWDIVADGVGIGLGLLIWLIAGVVT